MFYDKKVCRSVGVCIVTDLKAGRTNFKNENLIVAIECRGKPGRWRSSFLSCPDGKKL